MSKIKDFFDKYISFPDIMRRVILSWMVAIAIEYYRLPTELRDLSVLDGLAQMSLGLILALTVCLTVVLSVASRFFKTAKIERWGIAAVFAVIAIGTLVSNFSAAYCAACALILLIFVLFALYGWESNDD